MMNYPKQLAVFVICWESVGVISGKGPGSFEDVRVLSVEPITELIPVLKAALK